MDNVGEDVGSDTGEGKGICGDLGSDLGSEFGGPDFGTNGTSVTRAFSTGSHNSTSSAALPKRRKNSASV